MTLTVKRGKKGKGSRSFFRGFLFIMLFLSLANAVYVFKFMDQRPESTAVMERAVPVQVPLPPLPATAKALPRKWGNGPGWRGTVNVEKSAGGGHDIIINALDTIGNGVTLTSFEVTLQNPESQSLLPADFVQEATNRLKAHVEFPTKGEWMINVRLHRDLSTLQFSQRVRID